MEGLATRSLTEGDRDLLADLVSRVSPQSMISRFHGVVVTPTPSLLDRLLDLAPGQREALIALDDEGVVAVVRYARDTQEGDTADVAALVADEWQHHGVGPELMRQLARRARAAGISRFRGDMLSDNAAAQRLMTTLGQAVSSRRADGHTVMIIALAPA
jgi:acetyltransferase